jgi:hypothetical protein
VSSVLVLSLDDPTLILALGVSIKLGKTTQSLT